MIIENYSDKWKPDVMRLVENFHREAVAEYVGETFSVETMLNVIKGNEATNSNNAFLMIVDGVCEGMIYGIRIKSPTSGKVMYQEIIWYVNKPHRRHGVRLLREVEKRLKSQGINDMIMGVLENSKAEKLKQFYERIGYKLLETQYIRNL